MDVEKQSKCTCKTEAIMYSNVKERGREREGEGEWKRDIHFGSGLSSGRVWPNQIFRRQTKVFHRPNRFKASRVEPKSSLGRRFAAFGDFRLDLRIFIHKCEWLFNVQNVYSLCLLIVILGWVWIFWFVYRFQVES